MRKRRRFIERACIGREISYINVCLRVSCTRVLVLFAFSALPIKRNPDWCEIVMVHRARCSYNVSCYTRATASRAAMDESTRVCVPMRQGAPDRRFQCSPKRCVAACLLAGGDNIFLLPTILLLSECSRVCVEKKRVW